MTMKSKQKLAAFIGTCCLLYQGAVLADTIKIGIAGEPYPPFAEKTASGKWQGFEIDIANSICAKIKAQCQITEVAWDGIIPSLNSNKIDVIMASMSITPEREKTISFSIPYYATPVAFYGAKSMPKAITPTALNGKIIGVQTATPNADYVKKAYGAHSTVKFYNTQDEVNADLAAGRIDVQIADALGMLDFMASPAAASLAKLGTVPHDPMFGPGIGAGIRKSDAALKKRLDVAINEIFSSGEFKRIQSKYFDFSVAPK